MQGRWVCLRWAVDIFMEGGQEVGVGLIWGTGVRYVRVIHVYIHAHISVYILVNPGTGLQEIHIHEQRNALACRQQLL